MFRSTQRDIGLQLRGLDVLAIAVAWFVAVAIRHVSGITPEYTSAYLWTGALWLVVTLLTFDSLELYRGRFRGIREASEVLKGLVLALMAFLTVSFFYRSFAAKDFNYSRLVLGYFVVLAPTLVLTLRSFYHRFHDARSKPTRVVIVGTGRTADSVAREVERLKGLGYQIHEKIPDLGRLEEILGAGHVDEVIVAVADLSTEATQKTLELGARHGVMVKLVPTFYELALNRMEWDDLNGIPILSCPAVQVHTVTQSWLKRGVDVLSSGLGLLILSPLLIGVAIAIKLTSPGPVLFFQRRVGIGGREFDFIKFRTMYINSAESVHKAYAAQWIRPEENPKPAEAAPATPAGDAPADPSRPGSHDHSDAGVFKLVQDKRITSIGRFLRKFSIDELPQLYNVLIGDMSLVGPRPPIPYEVEMYNDWEKRRLAVRPGITGLWQVSGRNRLSFREMVALDLDYIQNWNLMLDFKILLRTIPVVLCWWEAF